MTTMQNVWVMTAALGICVGGLLRLRSRAGILASKDLGRGQVAKCGGGDCSASSSGVQENSPNDKLVVEIAYCLRCKWGIRASWLAQELLNTFERELSSVNLAPSMEGGTLVVTLWLTKHGTDEAQKFVLFDRKAQDGEFPNPKDIKRALRDSAFPGQALGKCLEKK